MTILGLKTQLPDLSTVDMKKGLSRLREALLMGQREYIRVIFTYWMAKTAWTLTWIWVSPPLMGVGAKDEASAKSPLASTVL